MEFSSRILIHPGLGNSGERHWQTLWEKRFPGFSRVEQSEWEKPVCETWIDYIQHVVMEKEPGNVVLVGHSLACCAIGYWAKKYQQKIRGALLVAPSDTEAKSYPEGTTGFKPMPLEKLPFPSITVMSTNDVYVSIDRAQHFSRAWGSESIDIGNAGHINAESNLGFWEFGLELLGRLDKSGLVKTGV